MARTNLNQQHASQSTRITLLRLASDALSSTAPRPSRPPLLAPLSSDPNAPPLLPASLPTPPPPPSCHLQAPLPPSPTPSPPRLLIAGARRQVRTPPYLRQAPQPRLPRNSPRYSHSVRGPERGRPVPRRDLRAHIDPAPAPPRRLHARSELGHGHRLGLRFPEDEAREGCGGLGTAVSGGAGAAAGRAAAPAGDRDPAAEEAQGWEGRRHGGDRERHTRALAQRGAREGQVRRRLRHEYEAHARHPREENWRLSHLEIWKHHHIVQRNQL